MRKLVHRGMKLKTGVKHPMLLLRWQGTLALLKSKTCTSLGFIFKVQLHYSSLSSSSSCGLSRFSVLGENSVKRFLTQPYVFDDKEGKYLSSFPDSDPKWLVINGMTFLHSVFWVWSRSGNIFTFPLERCFFKTASLFLNARSLSVEVRMFSFVPCTLVFKLFKCWWISAKYASFICQFVDSRHPQKQALLFSLKKSFSSCCSSNTLVETLPLKSHRVSVCRRSVTWSFCMFSHNLANMQDFRGCCFIKLTMFTVISRTCFKSSLIIFETRTSWWRKQWVVTSEFCFLSCVIKSLVLSQ